MDESTLSRVYCGFLMAVSIVSLSIFSLALQTHGGGDAAGHQKLLNEPVRGFNNGGKPLVPTLLDIAGRYHIPMGIEKVTPDALSSALSIILGRGTVATMLDACVSKLPGYAWKEEQGAVVVYGPTELADPANLFNLRISDFSVPNATLNEANNHLRDLDFSSPAASPKAPSAKGPVGMGGDSPGIGGLENKRFNLSLKNASVREILGRIVVLSRSTERPIAWVANVSPDALHQAPSNGLWRLVPVGDLADPTP